MNTPVETGGGGGGGGGGGVCFAVADANRCKASNIAAPRIMQPYFVASNNVSV